MLKCRTSKSDLVWETDSDGEKSSANSGEKMLKRVNKIIPSNIHKEENQILFCKKEPPVTFSAIIQIFLTVTWGDYYILLSTSAIKMFG